MNGAEVEMELGRQDKGIKNSMADYLLQLLSMNRGGKPRRQRIQSKEGGLEFIQRSRGQVTQGLGATRGVCTEGFKQGSYFRNKKGHEVHEKGHEAPCQVGMGI